MKQSTFTLCDECGEPVKNYHVFAVRDQTADFHKRTRWLCPQCYRSMRRSEQGEPDGAQD